MNLNVFTSIFFISVSFFLIYSLLFRIYRLNILIFINKLIKIRRFQIKSALFYSRPYRINLQWKNFVLKQFTFEHLFKRKEKPVFRYKDCIDLVVYKSIGPQVSIQLLGYSDVSGTFSFTVSYFKQGEVLVISSSTALRLITLCVNSFHIISSNFVPLAYR